MRALRFLRAVVAELVSLLVDDVATFLGAVLGLLVTYVLAHHWAGSRAADGFVLFTIVWVAMGLSLRWEVRRRSSPTTRG